MLQSQLLVVLIALANMHGAYVPPISRLCKLVSRFTLGDNGSKGAKKDGYTEIDKQAGYIGKRAGYFEKWEEEYHKLQTGYTDKREEYYELWAEYGSATSIYQHQARRGRLENLRLDRFSFPKQLPPSAHSFDFFMNQGYDCFSVPRFMTKICDEGRLDLLKYFHELNPKLIPAKTDLELAAERGWVDIIAWAHQLRIYPRGLNNLVAILAINRHFKALEWLMGEIEVIFDENMIQKVISAGALEALKWIDGKQPMEKGEQEWANIAAKHCHLPILKWLYEEFRLFPHAYYLKNSTIDMLEWINSTDPALIGPDLVYHGIRNFSLLQWVLQNSPQSIDDKARKLLPKRVNSMAMMLWLYDSLRLYPHRMDWAYKIGDLKAIEWAIENCQILPMPKDALCAAENGHVHITKWFCKNYPEKLDTLTMLKGAIKYGNITVAEDLRKGPLPKKVLVSIDPKVVRDQRLSVLKWAHKSSFWIEPVHEMDTAAAKGDLQTLLWLAEAFPTVKPSLMAWNTSAEHGHCAIYKLLLNKYPGQGTPETDICLAMAAGHLEVIKVILEKYPQHAEHIYEFEVTKLNHHIHRWFQ